MLRAGLGLRGLGGDLRRRWSEKPLTAGEADNPNAAAKSVGAAAENELRVVAGAYRKLVPPGARAAYDRTADEVAEAVNKQTSDAVRARARAAHEEGARATFDAIREQLVAAHDEAVRDGDHPRAETLAGQIADLDHFRRAYRRHEDAAKAKTPTAPDTAAKPEESPAPIDAPPAPSEAPVPASSDSVPTPASTEPAPGHDPGALMPGSEDSDTAKALSPEAPKGIGPEQRVKPTERRDPATASTMDEMGQYTAPTDHARALRGLFLEIPRLGRRGADGKPLATPEEFDAHLEKARENIRPEHFAAYEAIVRRLQAGEISALAAERQLRDLYEVVPAWERLGEMVLDAIPMLGTVKAGIELAETLKKFHAALAAGDHDEAEKLAIEAMALSAGLLPLGKIAAKAGGKALGVVGLRSTVAHYLEQRAGARSIKVKSDAARAAEAHELRKAAEAENRRIMMDGRRIDGIRIGPASDLTVAPIGLSIRLNRQVDENAYWVGRIVQKERINPGQQRQHGAYGEPCWRRSESTPAYPVYVRDAHQRCRHDRGTAVRPPIGQPRQGGGRLAHPPRRVRIYGASSRSSGASARPARLAETADRILPSHDSRWHADARRRRGTAQGMGQRRRRAVRTAARTASGVVLRAQPTIAKG